MKVQARHLQRSQDCPSIIEPSQSSGEDIASLLIGRMLPRFNQGHERRGTFPASTITTRKPKKKTLLTQDQTQIDAEFRYLIQWETKLLIVPYFMLIFGGGSRTELQKRATAVNEYAYSLLSTSFQHLGCIGGEVIDGRGWRKYIQMYPVATPATLEAPTNARHV